MSSLSDLIERYRQTGAARFHTPGHKGNLPPIDPALDVTELPMWGSLMHDADGPIRDLERRAAAVFGAGDCALSCGGATLAIQAMLRLFVPAGGAVVMGRNLHAAAVNAAVLLDLTPVWLAPRPEPGLPGRYHPDDVAALLREHPEARAVYLTVPDYYGALSPLRPIAEVCRRAGAALLIDNAHGSHLAFMGGGLHPLQQGVDASVDSLHKTLPVLTGGAALLLRDPRDPRELRGATALFGSTSPSFLILQSIERMLDWIGTADFAPLTARVKKIYSAVEAAGGARFPGAFDPARIALPLDGNSDPAPAERYFYERGVAPEWIARGAAVFIPGPHNGEADFRRLEKALAKCPFLARELPEAAPLPLPSAAMSHRAAALSPWEVVPIAQAAGRVAQGAVTVCPPGAPLVMPGEWIDAACTERLEQSGADEIRVVKINR